MYFDLHRHDEASSFDGFGTPEENAKLAKSLGYKALGIANHGNTHTLVRHHFACKEEGIKPILGVEAYFLPKHKEKHRGYHLCVFAKNVKGYQNLNRTHSKGEEQKYYNAIIDFDILEEHAEGLIVTNACVGSFISQSLIKGNKPMAIKAAKEFKRIFGEDFYFEIQPHAITDEGVQEKLNYDLYMLGKELDIKCILTSDSHYGNKEDFLTYLKMHEIGKHDFFDIESTYAKKYMPSEKEIGHEFLNMHDAKRNGNEDWSIPDPVKFLKTMLKNLDELQAKVDGDILDNLDSGLPVFDEMQDSKKLIKQQIIKGLKKRDKYNKQYMERIKEELDVIFYHKFEDYFLMVADYVTWAKDRGIAVGPGRGSGCNSLVNYAMHITDVDPILFELDFYRFLGKDKKGMPDIDVDFERDRRDEVIDYLLNKYPNNSAQVSSYGLYQVDNLVNDLAKLTDLENDKSEIADVKRLIKQYVEEDNSIDFDKLMEDPSAVYFDRVYGNFFTHFRKLYQQMRFVGTHAAGIAITKHNILDYTALKKDSKSGNMSTQFDMNDLQKLDIEKFDVLGLTAMSAISELRQMTGHDSFNEDWVEDEKLLHEFDIGSTDGIFQFDKPSVQDLLTQIRVSDFKDVVAASSMNRPGPLSRRMHEEYKENKENPELVKENAYSKYLKDSHGSLIYQEQTLMIATQIGGLQMADARLILKMNPEAGAANYDRYHKHHDNFLNQFIHGSKEHGISEDEARELFESFFNYAFNKGHAVGYALIAIEEMYYKVYHPTHYWYVRMKYTSDPSLRAKFKSNAVGQGTVLFLPHVNYSAEDSLREVEGELVIQEGLLSIKGVGEKAAQNIQKQRDKGGVYISYDDFYDRARNRAVHKGVIKTLDEEGALDFNKESYIIRLKRYNSSLYARSQYN